MLKLRNGVFLLLTLATALTFPPKSFGIEIDANKDIIVISQVGADKMSAAHLGRLLQGHRLQFSAGDIERAATAFARGAKEATVCSKDGRDSVLVRVGN